MKQIVHPIYSDYPEQPYISPDRNLKEWIDYPERFPYGIVERKQMERLPEGVLPGDIIMLWRIHFGTFTTETVIPQYFEYRYGVNSAESIQTLIKLNYIEKQNAMESLGYLTVARLVKILEKNKLNTKGKKVDLLLRIKTNISIEKMGKEFSLRGYQITPSGSFLLEKYDRIIQKHGPKV